MFSFFNRFFIRGLILVLPITVTFYVILYGSIRAEKFFGSIIRDLIGPQYYVTGLGILLTVFSIFLVGVLASNFITKRIVYFFTSRFSRVPLIRAIYNPLKDLMGLFSSSAKSEMSNKKVVIVNLEKMGIECIGLVTRDNFDEFAENTFTRDNIIVYIPMSYMLGGFSVIAKRSQVRSIDIPVDQAIRLAITGWVKSDDEF